MHTSLIQLLFSYQHQYSDFWRQIQNSSSTGWSPQEQTIFKYQAKTMKVVLSFVANICELVLQQRLSPSKQSLQHLQEIRCELDLLQQEQSPSEHICHLLVHKEFYQVRNRLSSKLKHERFENMVVTINFTLTDKLTSLKQSAQIWRISVVQKEGILSKEEMTHEKIHLLKQIVGQIASQYIFSEVVLNREISRKYIIDFQIKIVSSGDARDEGVSLLSETHHMWSVAAGLDARHQIKIDCYWRSQMEVSGCKRSPCNGIAKKSKTQSEDTCGDSGEIILSPRGNDRKMRSLSSQLPMFEIYDSQLDMTVLSNDSDSLSGGHVVREVDLGEDDEFELLIQEDENEDDIFLKENDRLFQEWDVLATANFH